MYGLIWRLLPGPIWLKVIQAMVLVGAIVYALMTWGYPWVSGLIDADPVMGG